MVSNVNARTGSTNLPIQYLLEAIRGLWISIMDAMTSPMPARISMTNAMTTPKMPAQLQDNFRITKALMSSDTNQSG